jgi:ABC-type methionine transport system ATPase subunit
MICSMSTARLHLTFPQNLTSEPIVHRMGTEFGLVVNIRRANLEEDRGGWIILEVTGEDDRVASAIAWLAEQGLQVDRIEP